MRLIAFDQSWFRIFDPSFLLISFSELMKLQLDLVEAPLTFDTPLVWFLITMVDYMF